MKNVSLSDSQCTPGKPLVEHLSGLALRVSSLCLFQQLIAASCRQSEHRERRMLVTCGRKRIAAEHIQIGDVMGSAEGIQHAFLRIGAHPRGTHFVN